MISPLEITLWVVLLVAVVALPLIAVFLQVRGMASRDS